MKLTTRPANRRTFRTRRATAPVVTVPTQGSDAELSELYTWAVNAAVEDNRPELAYELARSFAREA